MKKYRPRLNAKYYFVSISISVLGPHLTLKFRSNISLIWKFVFGNGVLNVLKEKYVEHYILLLFTI